jgi:Fe-S oxidoreductase
MIPRKVINMNYSSDPELSREIAKYGARDMELCMQCAACSASCPLSTGANSFPRKIYRYIQLGLREKLLSSPEPWLCYYCGECNRECPRGAEPAETMMATRRWLTAQYDWTGLAKRFYLSEAWEIGALTAIALCIILLFVFFHGPVITDRVSVNSFAPVKWIEIGDLLMAAVLTFFLMTNAFRMYRFIMKNTDIPFSLYITEAKTFILHFITQKRWRECGEDRSRWLKHFTLVTGYMTMMTLIIVFIRWFQVDDSSWHFSSIFGYYATGVLMFITVEMFLSRRKKEELIHRYSEPSDWLFLVLLFFTSLTGIIMHLFRISGWPIGTYLMYVIHLAVAVPMLVIEVPFGKWSHLFYRPLAVFLASVKEKASKESGITADDLISGIGDTFMSCMQCGTCASLCPAGRDGYFSPREVLRHISLKSGTEHSVGQAAWECLTCNICVPNCPRGIGIIDMVRRVRELNISTGKSPSFLNAPLKSLRENGNPWGGDRSKRMEWAGSQIPEFTPNLDYCLFTCCTTAYDTGNHEAGRALIQLLQKADASFGSLGVLENCCGDHARQSGAVSIFNNLAGANSRLFTQAGVKRILTTSPHCLNAFKNAYPGFKGALSCEHYTELLDRLITEGRLKPTSKIDLTVTYHDPCYLGRHNGIYQAPRRILMSIPGLTLVEMAGNRENSLCCGGGSPNAWRKDPESGRFGVMRIEEALGSGAEVIATACPYCARMFNDAVLRLRVGNRIAVMDVATILLQSVTAANQNMAAGRIASGVYQEAEYV